MNSYIEKNISGKLYEIIDFKLKEIERRKKRNPLSELKKNLKKSDFIYRDFYFALKNPDEITLIAEIKKASPSIGKLNTGVNILNQARIYESTGANAISVLTDKKFFKGDLNNLAKIKSKAKIPVLQKDFIIDPYQIYEAKAYGADAILLIASILTQESLNQLFNLAQKLNLDCLVETHAKEDIQKALSLKAKIIGINSRNLATFKLNLNQITKLAPLIPKNRLLVAESGIKTKNDIIKLKKAGIKSVLVGAALMRAGNIKGKIKELKIDSKTKIKICGITDLENAQKIAKLNISYMGFIINHPKSPRNNTPQRVKKIIKNLKKINPSLKFAGVFVDEPIDSVQKIISDCNLDIAQLHGNENTDYIKRLKKYSEVWKAIIIKEKKDILKIKKYQNIADKILLDAGRGSGKQIDFSLIKNQEIDIIAGGVGLESISKTLKLKPRIIDLNSKIETAPGIKNINKIKKIINKIQFVNS